MDASTASDASARSVSEHSLAGVPGTETGLTPSTNDPTFRQFAEENLGPGGAADLFGGGAVVTPSVARPDVADDVDSSPNNQGDDESVPSLADAPTAGPYVAPPATDAATLAAPTVETASSGGGHGAKPPVEEVDIEESGGVGAKGTSVQNFGDRRGGAVPSGLPSEGYDVAGTTPVGSVSAGVPIGVLNDSPSEESDVDDVYDDGTIATESSSVRIRKLEEENAQLKRERDEQKKQKASPAALGSLYRIDSSLPAVNEESKPLSEAVQDLEYIVRMLTSAAGVESDSDHPMLRNPFLQKHALQIQAADRANDTVSSARLYKELVGLIDQLYFDDGSANPPALAATGSSGSDSVGSNGGSDDTYERNSFMAEEDEDPRNVGGIPRGAVPEAPPTPLRRPLIPPTAVMGTPRRTTVNRNPFSDSRSFTRSGGIQLSNSVADLLSVGDPNATFLTVDPESRRQMAELIQSGTSPRVGMTFDLKALVSKWARLNAADYGYREEQDRIMCTPGTPDAVKLSAQLGGWDFQSTSLKDKSTINEGNEKQVLAGFAENSLKFLKIERHYLNYDLSQMATVYRVKKGVNLKMKPEEMVLYDVHDLFEMDEDGTKTLWTKWACIDEKEIGFMQTFYNFHPSVCDADQDSNRLAYNYLGNMMTENLRKEVVRAMEGNFSEQAHGATTLLWVMLNRILKGTSETERILLNQYSKMTNVGPKAMNNGENISAYREHVTNVLIRPLVAMDAFDSKRDDPVEQLLEGLSKCSVNAFSSHFARLHTEYMSTRFSTGGLLRHNVGTGLSSEENGEKCIELLEGADNHYMFLSQLGKWKPAGGSSARAYLGSRITTEQLVKSGGKCFNQDSGCDGNHTLSDCPNPHNQELIDKRRKEYYKERDDKKAAAKASGGGSSGGGGGVPTRASRDSNAAGSGSGSSSGKKTYRVKTVAGVKTVQWKCNDCNIWCNHLSELHSRALSMGDSFSMAVARPNDAGVKKMKSDGLRAASATNSASSTPSKAGSGPTKADVEEYETKRENIVAQMALHSDQSSAAYQALNTAHANLKKAWMAKFKDF